MSGCCTNTRGVVHCQGDLLAVQYLFGQASLMDFSPILPSQAMDTLAVASAHQTAVLKPHLSPLPPELHAP
jgi:hypothetical protein